MSTTEPESTSSSSTSDESKSAMKSSPINGRSRNSAGKKSPSVKVQSPTTCTWCSEAKTPLKYVLPSQNGKKEFCSESCIAAFRKCYSKGACIECDNAIRANAPSHEFCSTFCLNKNKRKSPSSPQAPSTSQNKSLNNNNSNLSNNNKQKSTTEANNNNTIKEHYAVTKMSPMFQYEAFHVFDWKEYLKASGVDCLYSKFVNNICSILGNGIGASSK